MTPRKPPTARKPRKDEYWKLRSSRIGRGFVQVTASTRAGKVRYRRNNSRTKAPEIITESVGSFIMRYRYVGKEPPVAITTPTEGMVYRHTSAKEGEGYVVVRAADPDLDKIYWQEVRKGGIPFPHQTWTVQSLKEFELNHNPIGKSLGQFLEPTSSDPSPAYMTLEEVQQFRASLAPSILELTSAAATLRKALLADGTINLALPASALLNALDVLLPPTRPIQRKLPLKGEVWRTSGEGILLEILDANTTRIRYRVIDPDGRTMGDTFDLVDDLDKFTDTHHLLGTIEAQ